MNLLSCPQMPRHVQAASLALLGRLKRQSGADAMTPVHPQLERNVQTMTLNCEEFKTSVCKPESENSQNLKSSC